LQEAGARRGKTVTSLAVRSLHDITVLAAAQVEGGCVTTWLFRALVPGRHLAVNGLVRQLNEHGIQARISRSAALINLAADLPASVLANLLGIHINTAVRWAHRAKRDWTSHLAARAAPVGEPVKPRRRVIPTQAQAVLAPQGIDATPEPTKQTH
jgi:hypothetical protein